MPVPEGSGLPAHPCFRIFPFLQNPIRPPKEVAVTDTEMLALFRDALHAVAPARAEAFQDLTLETPIKELNLDSVVLMELVGEVEERVQVSFPDDELAQLSSFGDLARLVREARG